MTSASRAPGRRANHLTATPADELSWRPMQRSTRVVVFVALAVTLFYMIFLLNPAYRGNTWIWILVLFAEGITVFNASRCGGRCWPTPRNPTPPEVYAWRRRLLTGELKPTIDVFITVYGEPLEIVLGTIRAARDMTVEHRTWVLDDGDSDELRDVAATGGRGLPTPQGAPARQGRQHQRGAAAYRRRVRGDPRRRPRAQPRLPGPRAAAHAGPGRRLRADAAGVPERAGPGCGGLR